MTHLNLWLWLGSKRRPDSQARGLQARHSDLLITSARGRTSTSNRGGSRGAARCRTPPGLQPRQPPHQRPATSSVTVTPWMMTSRLQPTAELGRHGTFRRPQRPVLSGPWMRSCLAGSGKSSGVLYTPSPSRLPRPTSSLTRRTAGGGDHPGTVHAKMLRLELLRVKADLERDSKTSPSSARSAASPCTG